MEQDWGKYKDGACVAISGEPRDKIQESGLKNNALCFKHIKLKAKNFS